MSIGTESALRVSAAALGILVISAQANAAIVTKDFDGNDCAGYFGQGFDACTIFVDDNGQTIELSPVIAKFGADLTLSETNDTVYPSVTGSEFSFSGNTPPDNKTGTWTYAPGPDDPGVRYWATKAGSGFKLFWSVDDAEVATGGACDVVDVYSLACLDAAMVMTSADWTTPENKELSHITFYDTEIIPLPAAAWLFGSALCLLGWARRRQT